MKNSRVLPLSRKRLFRYIPLVALLLFFLVINVPFPVHLELDALEVCPADAAIAVNRTILLDGYYRFNLFSPDSFTGAIHVSGYENQAGSYAADPIPLESHHGGQIVYRFPLEPSDNMWQERQFLLGWMHARRPLRNIIIRIAEHSPEDAERLPGGGGSFRTDTGIYVLAGVRSREEALHKINVLNGYS